MVTRHVSMVMILLTINETVSDPVIRPVVVMSLPRARTPRGAASPAPSHKSYGASTRVSGSPGPGSEVRQDSFWDKVGTLGRKKKAAEVQQVEVEGKHAIDSPGEICLTFDKLNLSSTSVLSNKNISKLIQGKQVNF